MKTSQGNGYGTQSIAREENEIHVDLKKRKIIVCREANIHVIFRILILCMFVADDTKLLQGSHPSLSFLPIAMVSLIFL